MKIGIFDSGYGGLTIWNRIQQRLPQYDYIYLGDNARMPYGTRSFEVVYNYTLQCVQTLFDLGCQLVILACNTASAKALRSIQQHDLPRIAPNRRVLGVIRPTVEAVDTLTKTNVVGLVATEATIQSHSYLLELAKMCPDVKLVEQACPMWVPIIENNEHHSEGADFFVKKYLDRLFEQNQLIDTLILGCTHYPLLIDKIRQYTPHHVAIIEQGGIVADSLADYLQRHPEIESLCSKNGQTVFYTTENAEKFQQSASLFLQRNITVKHLSIKE
ncbi:MAG: glutamate racemase [Bacteroidales bacterium]|nr:glutamate racemase [Bacteroidales bacterium]